MRGICTHIRSTDIKRVPGGHSRERAEVTRTLRSRMGRAGGAEFARTRMEEEAQRFKSSRRRALSCPCVTSDGGGGTAASLSAAAVSFS